MSPRARANLSLADILLWAEAQRGSDATTSEHDVHSIRDRERFAFSCSCGVAFVVVTAGYSIARVAREGAADPRSCPRAADALHEATGLGAREVNAALERVAREKTPFVPPADPFAEPPTKGRRVASDADSEAAVRRLVAKERRRATVGASAGRPRGSSDAARADVENHGENRGAGRVSRPPQSASTSAKQASGKGAPSSAEGGCSSDATAVTRREDGLPDLLMNKVDMLVIGWEVRRSRALLERLEAAKKVAQTTRGDGPEQEFELGGEKWKIAPKGGRRYQYVLENQVALLGVSSCAPGSQHPALRFQVRSETLCSKGLRWSHDWTQRIANVVHEEGCAEPPEEGAADETPVEKRPPAMKVSRIDLAADFLNFPFDDMEHAHVLCRARRRGRHWKADPDDLASAEFWGGSGMTKTGETWGKGSLMARGYDKTREIVDQSGKTYLYAFWARCKACGARQNEHEAVLAKGEVVGYAGCKREGCAAFVIDEEGFHESRECGSCAGAGTVERVTRCPSCRNGPRKKQTCETCDRTGEKRRPKACPACKGKKVLCDRVVRFEFQLGRETLTELVKGVQRTCPTCAGLGERRFTRACKKCRGKGGWECLSCKGTGARKKGPCSRCEGSGRIGCRRCAGAGEVQTNRACRKCRERGVKLDKPKPEEVADPQGRLVVLPVDGAEKVAGAPRNAGEDLELDIDTIEGLEAALKAIWRYCVGGGQGVRPWLSWRRPTGNKQKTLWPLRDEWRVVQDAPKWGAEEVQDELVRLKRRRGKLKKLVPQLAGLVIGMGALLMDERDAERDAERLPSPDESWSRLYDLSMDYVERQAVKDSKRSWDERMRFRRAESALWGLRGDQERKRAAARSELVEAVA